MNSKIDMSIPAQVCCVTDTDGTIHPKWIRFKDENEGIITIQNLEILKEHTDAIWNNFLCSALMYGQTKSLFYAIIMDGTNGPLNTGQMKQIVNIC